MGKPTSKSLLTSLLTVHQLKWRYLCWLFAVLFDRKTNPLQFLIRIDLIVVHKLDHWALHSSAKSFHKPVRFRVISRRDTVLCFCHLEHFLTHLVDKFSSYIVVERHRNSLSWTDITTLVQPSCSVYVHVVGINNTYERNFSEHERTPHLSVGLQFYRIYVYVPWTKWHACYMHPTRRFRHWNMHVSMHVHRSFNRALNVQVSGI